MTDKPSGTCSSKPDRTSGQRQAALREPRRREDQDKQASHALKRVHAHVLHIQALLLIEAVPVLNAAAVPRAIVSQTCLR